MGQKQMRVLGQTMQEVTALNVYRISDADGKQVKRERIEQSLKVRGCVSKCTDLYLFMDTRRNLSFVLVVSVNQLDFVRNYSRPIVA